MNNKCIICGKEATTLSEMKTRIGSVITVALCEKHEKARLLGKRKVKKGLKKAFRRMI